METGDRASPIDLTDADGDLIDKCFVARTEWRIRQIADQGVPISGKAVLNMYRLFDGNLDLPWIVTSWPYKEQEHNDYNRMLKESETLGLTDLVLSYHNVRIDDVPVLYTFPLVTKKQLGDLDSPEKQKLVADLLFAITLDFIGTYRPSTIIVMHCIFAYSPQPIGEFSHPSAKLLSSTIELAERRDVEQISILGHQIRRVMSRHPIGLRTRDPEFNARPRPSQADRDKRSEKLTSQAFDGLFRDYYGSYGQKKRDLGIKDPDVIGRRNKLLECYEKANPKDISSPQIGASKSPNASQSTTTLQDCIAAQWSPGSSYTSQITSTQATSSLPQYLNSMTQDSHMSSQSTVAASTDFTSEATDQNEMTQTMESLLLKTPQKPPGASRPNEENSPLQPIFSRLNPVGVTEGGHGAAKSSKMNVEIKVETLREDSRDLPSVENQANGPRKRSRERSPDSHGRRTRSTTLLGWVENETKAS